MRIQLLPSLAVPAALLMLAAPTSAGPGAQQNTPYCYATTSLAGGRAIEFVAHCKPPDDLALAELTFQKIETKVPIRGVRPTASLDADPAGMQCRRAARFRIACAPVSDPALTVPTGHTVRGRFKLKLKSDRCRLVARFAWSGGGCVGYDPVSGACADVGLGAGRRFGPPSGC